MQLHHGIGVRRHRGHIRVNIRVRRHQGQACLIDLFEFRADDSLAFLKTLMAKAKPVYVLFLTDNLAALSRMNDRI